MSLINDALKRASQQPPPPAAGPALRPAMPEPPTRAGIGLAVPIFLLVIALGSALFVWQVWEKRDLAVSARVPAAPQTPVPEPAKLPSPEPAAPAPTAAPEPVPAPEAVAPAPAAIAVPPPPAQAPSASTVPGLAAATNALAQAAALAATPAPANAVMEPSPQAVPADPPPPKPAPPKLQAIVFDPHRPSATISGKTVFVGDKVGPFRVTSITQDSVTLAGSGSSTTLSLP